MDDEITLGSPVLPPFKAFSYLPRDLFPYFPWDDFLYFPWYEMAYLPWENLPYLPWDKYPGFPWDDLPYFPWDDLPYLPGDNIPYLPEIPDWHVTLTPPWQFVDIGCPNMQTVAITIQTDLVNNPPIQVEDCSSPYTCYPVDGYPGRYYCTAYKPIYSSNNCPLHVCVMEGNQQICQDIDPNTWIDCPYEIQKDITPEPQGPNCSQYNENECLGNGQTCTWVSGTVGAGAGYCKNK
jgi:hypothetical protein